HRTRVLDPNFICPSQDLRRLHALIVSRPRGVPPKTIRMHHLRLSHSRIPDSKSHHRQALHHPKRSAPLGLQLSGKSRVPRRVADTNK
ncbi:hypothetical protein IscW_ISCW001925, partial [Ixodes scapularis]